MQYEHVFAKTLTRCTISFDFQTDGDGYIDWYRLRYAWELNVTPQVNLSSLDAPLCTACAGRRAHEIR